MSNPDSEVIWQEFLQSIYDDSYKNTEEEDEEEEEEVNDPEYRISEDLLKLDDDWDFRDERAFRVSDYELDLLLDEEDNEMEVETVETAIKCTEKSDVFDSRSIGILMSQLSEHIQLLSQTYFQSFNTNGLQSVAENAFTLLNEIKEISKSNPLFTSININSSLNLISKYPINKSCQTSRSMTSWRTLPITKEIQRIYISNTDVFTHPWLLPFCGSYDKEINKNKSKTSFTLSEDHLIALGLEQFSPLFSLRKCYRYLKQLLLPTKTVDQIRTHIKNIKRRSTANESNENPIIYYYLNGKAPDLHTSQLDSDIDHSMKTVPEWYKKAMRARILRKDNRKLDLCSDQKKMKSLLVPNDKKKVFVLPIPSPVKQTNSIIKKYKHLNRLNQFKQNHSNSSSKLKKSSNIDPDFSENNNICLESNFHNLQNESETVSTDESPTNPMKELENPNTEQTNRTHKSNENNKMNSLITNGSECNGSANEISINEEDVEYDDESDLAALMTASSTITTKIKIKSKVANDANNCSVLQLNQNRKEGRKSLAVKQRESTLQLLSLENNEIDLISSVKEDILINNFLEKVRKSLSHQNYVHFLTLLTNFHQKRSEEKTSKSVLIKDIFIQIEDFLKQWNVNKDIISEFVLFLSAKQAEECGKMFEYLHWRRVFNFVSKLEKYSQIDGQCLSRFYRSLNQLKVNYENCNENRIQWAVNRSLNGHSYLMHHFSSLLLDSKPGEYLFENSDFDEMVIDSSDDEERTDSSEKICFETINIPESDDDLKFGTNECPCSTCHKESHQNIGRHCTSCSIRFIGGRVYLTQNHKKLCLAEIQFTESDSNNFDANRLNETTDEDIVTEIDREINAENQVSDKTRDKKSWTISDDKILLELCRSKVLDEKHNELSEDIFEEVANRLSKDTNEVIARFNKLIDLFASEQDSHPTKSKTE